VHTLILALLLVAGCPPSQGTDTGDTGSTDTGHTGDTSATDTSATDTGDTADSGDTGDTADTGTAPLPGNWDFEDWSTSNPPPGFTRDPADGYWSVVEYTGALQGDAAARLELADSGGDWTLSATDVVSVEPATTSVFHAWVDDDTPNVDANPQLEGFTGSTSTGTIQGTLSVSSTPGFRELTVDWTNPASGASDTLRPSLLLVQQNPTASSLTTDAWAITGPADIDVTDGQVDADTFLVAGTPGQTMDARASLDDQGVLYASTNWADQGSDHLLFVWVNKPDPGATVAPPWGKSGQVAAPRTGGGLLVMIQEESTKACEWRRYDPVASAWVTDAQGATCLSTGDGPRFEGSVHLAGTFANGHAVDLPPVLALSVGPWATDDGGGLKAEYQQPPGNGDGTVDASETAIFPRADLLAGRLVPHTP